MPPSSTNTITETKSHFLRAQTRLLTSPLQPSSTWQENLASTASSDPSPSPLPDKTLNDLITRLNAKLKSHNRLIFSPQSQRHVAEQIDALYWNEVVAEDTTQDKDTVWIPRDAELTDTSVVRGLPETLDAGEQQQERRYQELRARVVELVKRRDELRRKREGYRGLREMMGPFEDVKGDVQPNLVTRDGELAKELERMRVLIARVQGRIGDVQDRNGVDDTRVGMSEQQKLAQVMELG